jgi:hypothetical protein
VWQIPVGRDLLALIQCEGAEVFIETGRGRAGAPPSCSCPTADACALSAKRRLPSHDGIGEIEQANYRNNVHNDEKDPKPFPDPRHISMKRVWM